MTNRLKYIIISITALYLVACRDPEIIITPVDPDPPDPPVYFEKEVLGYVSNEQFQDLIGSNITMSNFTINSDNSGFFYGNPQFAEKRLIIKAKKEGYFPAYSLAIIDNQKLPWLKLIQHTLNTPRIVSGENGGTAIFDQGLQLKFESNSFIKSDSSIYLGKVNVYAIQYINDNPAHNYSFPLKTEGKNANDELKYLQSLTALSVEFRSESNEKLYLVRDAAITVGVLGKQNNIIPTSTVWNLNLKTAFWEETGKATNQGTFYNFKSKNLEALNIANGLESVMLSGVILVNGIASRSDMLLYNKSNNDIVYSVKTNDQGYWKVAVPKGIEIGLDILGTCELLYSQSIGTFNVDSKLDTIKIQSNDLTILSGKVYDCSNQTIKNGHVIVTLLENGLPGSSLQSKSVFNLDKNGFFRGNISICNKDQILKLVPFDRDQQLEGADFTTDSKGIIENIKLYTCKNKARSPIEIQYKNTIYYIDSCVATHSTQFKNTYTIFAYDKLENGLYVDYKLVLEETSNSKFELVGFSFNFVNGLPKVYFEGNQCSSVIERNFGVNPGDPFIADIKACSIDVNENNKKEKVTANIHIETILQ